jgi:hypothetical protein
VPHSLSRFHDFHNITTIRNPVVHVNSIMPTLDNSYWRHHPDHPCLDSSYTIRFVRSRTSGFRDWLQCLIHALNAIRLVITNVNVLGRRAMIDNAMDYKIHLSTSDIFAAISLPDPEARSSPDSSDNSRAEESAAQVLCTAATKTHSQHV